MGCRGRSKSWTARLDFEMVRWPDIAFQPSIELADEIGEAWSWLIGDRVFKPFLCSRLGDVFFVTDGGEVGWLSCSEGLIARACNSRTEFDEKCQSRGDEYTEWFGAGLIASLHSAGKVAKADECYAFVILPVFAECKYQPDNLNPVPAREVLIGQSELHKQIAELPEGSAVQISIVD